MYGDFLTDGVIAVFAAVIGLLFGSFLNCVALRVVRGENWVSDRSRCPSCGHVLGARDLIPVLSYLILRGRCRFCGAKISPRYPLTELLFSAVSVLVFLRFGLTAETARVFVLACCLFVLTLTDLESRLIPNGCLIIAAAAWLVTEPFLFVSWRNIATHVAAGLGFGAAILCLSLIMDRILGKASLGGGDVKLIAVLGLYLGVVGSMFMLLAASLLGIAGAACMRRLKKRQAIAFGPCLAAAGFLMLLYGGPLIEWYIGLLY